ncbi:MAG: ketoacyl-ACP synthase III [Planctomycetaceae bacterium]|nr:ketoacyl-ACP synthase III [Planctomycetaceae bacterium]
MQQHFEILGTGSELPGNPISAAEFEQQLNLPAGWIARHTQVEFRYAFPATETVASFAARAIRKAMLDAQITAGDVDLLIDCSTSRHQPIPCNAAVLLAELGPEGQGIAGMDVQGTCLGFLLGLNVANALLATSVYRHIVLICAEAALQAADPRDPESATLLSDGAAAAVLGRRQQPGDLRFLHQTFAEHLSLCQIRGGGSRLPSSLYSAETDADFRFQMDGPELALNALRLLPPLVQELLACRNSPAGVTHVDIAPVDTETLTVIPHQASPRTVELMRRRLRFPANRFINRSAVLGNMASASIPVVLDQLRREGVVSKSDQILLLGTSAGYAQAGMVFSL